MSMKRLNVKESCPLILMGQAIDIQHERFSAIFPEQRAFAVLEENNGHTLD
ncbi:hypothetical protein T4C_3378 [Trichinella pseudospiralis]|uniref:Uncharacterized protein n=1 Tax=Trichinella pseudospiralis TaxID=6337 RepID=A0A0V1IBY4_TRIPS|nr:hypothetical protein T4C_3378 [Trichinella pseudospiralis]